MVTQTAKNVLLEELETHQDLAGKSGKTWNSGIQIMGICQYKTELLASCQQSHISDEFDQSVLREP